ncbi:MAG: hypothetical protein QNJ64_16870 [Crocosphaera sp.]|nr:hypothetical protein [Crocosphaera sp.]
MTNPLESTRQHPHLAKQIIGLDLLQLEFLIVKAIAANKEKKRKGTSKKSGQEKRSGSNQKLIRV